MDYSASQLTCARSNITHNLTRKTISSNEMERQTTRATTTRTLSNYLSNTCDDHHKTKAPQEAATTMTASTRTSSSNTRTSQQICARCVATRSGRQSAGQHQHSRSNLFSLTTGAAAGLFLLLAVSLSQPQSVAEAASANRVNMHQVSRQTNQYFLNEFCDLQSKALRRAKKLKHASDTNSLYLTSRQTDSSVRVLPQKQQMPSSISFGLGSSAPAASTTAPVLKQLNCSIIVVAPQSHGLLVKVNSDGFPKNLTKLGITLNHDSPHAQHIQLSGENSTADYLLTQPQSSKIAINLQSFKPIDWSHVSFDILFTVYKKANSTGCPTKKWFDCGDNICVPSSLVCDNNRNCPNGNDEMIFYACYSPLFWSIAASCALALILVAIMIVVIMIVRNQRRRRGLTKLNSFSNHQLAADTDHEPHNCSKLDLTQAEQLANSRGLTLGGGSPSGSYLASNMYLGGFENPVWTNGTLPKGATAQLHQAASANLQ